MNSAKEFYKQWRSTKHIYEIILNEEENAILNRYINNNGLTKAKVFRLLLKKYAMDRMIDDKV